MGYLTGAPFSVVTLDPRLDAWIDKTLATGARLFTSKKRDGGQRSILDAWRNAVPSLNPDTGFS